MDKENEVEAILKSVRLKGLMDTMKEVLRKKEYIIHDQKSAREKKGKLDETEKKVLEAVPYGNVVNNMPTTEEIAEEVREAFEVYNQLEIYLRVREILEGLHSTGYVERVKPYGSFDKYTCWTRRHTGSS